MLVEFPSIQTSPAVLKKTLRFAKHLNKTPYFEQFQQIDVLGLLSTSTYQNQKEEAEKQIREEFAEMRTFLDKEESARIALLDNEEKEQKELMKKKTDSITHDILMFTHAIKTVDDEIANTDCVFLQVWKPFMHLY